MNTTTYKALQCINLQKLVNFFDENAFILHQSRYHQESFDIHCYLVIGNMITEYEAGRVSEEALVAACLHDIAKPRTAALNKRNEACFYGHENVTNEELAEFLDPSYPGFNKVADLVRAHMLPLGVGENTPEPWRGKNQKSLDKVLGKYDSDFKNDLLTLSDCDVKSGITDPAGLPSAIIKANAVSGLLETEVANPKPNTLYLVGKSVRIMFPDEDYDEAISAMPEFCFASLEEAKAKYEELAKNDYFAQLAYLVEASPETGFKLLKGWCLVESVLKKLNIG